MPAFGFQVSWPAKLLSFQTADETTQIPQSQMHLAAALVQVWSDTSILFAVHSAVFAGEVGDIKVGDGP